MTDRPRRSPAPRTTAALVAINAALLGALGLVSLSPPAGAQADPGRARGNYTLVGGELPFGNSNAIYVLDAANEELMALRWNVQRGTGELERIGSRSVREDRNATPSR